MKNFEQLTEELKDRLLNVSIKIQGWEIDADRLSPTADSVKDSEESAKLKKMEGEIKNLKLYTLKHAKSQLKSIAKKYGFKDLYLEVQDPISGKYTSK